MNITFGKRALPTSGAVAVFAAEAKLLPAAAELDEATAGQIRRAIAAGRFEGGAGETLELLAPHGLGLSRILLIGTGKAGKFEPLAAERAAAGAVRRLLKSGETTLSFVLDEMKGTKGDELAAHMAFAARLETTHFDTYKTKQKPNDKPSLIEVAILTGEAAKARKTYVGLEAVAEGVALARGLVMEPANVLYPAEFARRCRALKDLGVEVEVLGEKEMGKLGMNALLGVGQGSERESQLVIMHWKGSAKPKKPVVFVGKGVCFDTGGISIKPAGGMEEMKGDMGGAAAVTGAIHALAARKAKTWAIGLIGLVENMPDGKAQRPGDIVKSMSGQTIEIINTDAEGRLVLADVLWYAQDRFKPQFMVDLATLTGAIQAALGGEYAGLFSNSDQLSDRLKKAGEAEGEPVFRMPMGEAYDKMINSKFADMKNTGARFGGSITAAQFLKRFVNDVPWAHLDIAGVAWTDQAKPTKPIWASGYGVRLLNRLVADHYEG